MSITRRTMIAGVAFAASRGQAAPLVLAPQHAGRVMRTRDGKRVGPMEYDAAAFGQENGKCWRGSLGWALAYYFKDGRVIAGEDGQNDIVADWSR